jgi:lysophospholipase L1-like esterase
LQNYVKKLSLIISLSILFLLAVQTANAADGVNLFVNPAFDSGTTSWDGYSDGGTGTWSVTEGVATLNSGTATYCIYQADRNVGTGKYINMSVVYRTSDETQIKFFPGSGAWHTVSIIDDGEWHTVSHEITPAEHANGNIYLYISTVHSSTSIDFDYVNASTSDTPALTPTPTPVLKAGFTNNLLSYNVATGGEYGNTSGLIDLSTATLAANSSFNYTGAYSIQYSGASMFQGWRTSNITVTPNTAYSISFKIKGNAGGEKIYAMMEDITTGVAVPVGSPLYLTLTADWVQYNLSFNTTSTTTKLYFQEYISDGNAANWFTDDIRFYKDSYNGYNKYYVNGGDDATVYLMLTSPAWQTVTVDYETGDGSLTASGNYTTTSGTITFNNGETVKPITIPTINNQGLSTAGYFYVNITSITGADQYEYPSSMVFVKNNEAINNPYTVVAFGDSITYGYGTGLNTTYPAYLQLDQPKFNIINKGTSGDTVQDMKNKYNTYVNAFGPKYVIILGGVNDFVAGASVATVETRLQALYEWANANGTTPILCTLLPDNNDAGINAKIEELNTWIEGYAAANDYPIIDFYKVMEYPDNSNTMPAAWTMDGVHPSTLGYKIMADNASLILDTINPTEFEAPPSFTLSASSTSVQETNTTIILTVTKNKTTSGTYNVTIATVTGTASSPADYTAINSVLSFDNATNIQTVVLSIKYAPYTNLSSKSFMVELSNPTGNATLGEPHNLTIVLNYTGAQSSNRETKSSIITLIIIVILSIAAMIIGAGAMIKDAIEKGKMQEALYYSIGLIVFLMVIGLIFGDQISIMIRTFGI